MVTAERIVLALALVGGIALWLWVVVRSARDAARREERREDRRCRACGYPLTGDTCPECGGGGGFHILN
jgi:rRNA maturation endonuclease Nob1